jgi:Na+-transporting NADH:ubiquinone oxidoreductase subunit NqrB
MSARQPIAFYVRGIVALGLLFALTLMMAPAPEVNYLRAMIGVGLAVVIVKMLIRRYRPHWLPDRLGGTRPR